MTIHRVSSNSAEYAQAAAATPPRDLAANGLDALSPPGASAGLSGGHTPATTTSVARGALAHLAAQAAPADRSAAFARIDLPESDRDVAAVAAAHIIINAVNATTAAQPGARLSLFPSGLAAPQGAAPVFSWGPNPPVASTAPMPTSTAFWWNQNLAAALPNPPQASAAAGQSIFDIPPMQGLFQLPPAALSATAIPHGPFAYLAPESRSMLHGRSAPHPLPVVRPLGASIFHITTPPSDGSPPVRARVYHLPPAQAPVPGSAPLPVQAPVAAGGVLGPVVRRRGAGHRGAVGVNTDAQPAAPVIVGRKRPAESHPLARAASPTGAAADAPTTISHVAPAPASPPRAAAGAGIVDADRTPPRQIRRKLNDGAAAVVPPTPGTMLAAAFGGGLSLGGAALRSPTASAGGPGDDSGT